MTLTLDIPPSLEENLEQEAEREDISATEHATLLLYLVTALIEREGKSEFQNQVWEFIAQHSLDANRVAAVFELLVQQCLAENASESTYSSLLAWRNQLVHEPITAEGGMGKSAKLKRRTIHADPVMSRQDSAMGKYAHVPGTSDDYARMKQAEIDREDRNRD